MAKRVKRQTKDLRALNHKVPGIRYPADQGRAQLRGGKRLFARVLTSTNDPIKPSEGGQD